MRIFSQQRQINVHLPRDKNKSVESGYRFSNPSSSIVDFPRRVKTKYTTYDNYMYVGQRIKINSTYQIIRSALHFMEGERVFLLPISQINAAKKHRLIITYITTIITTQLFVSLSKVNTRIPVE